MGSAAFDTPDFAEALGYLRSTALGLSPRGITTKLIIPNDQILYTHVHAPGPELAKRRRQIKAGLEGRTPYGIEDLVYDWSGPGPEVNVAVVARETLAEAEAFAIEHRFNPVSFVGVPEGEAYPGEAFFGQTALSETLLTEGEKVERDQVAVAVIARDFPRGEAAAVTEAPAPETSAPVAADPAPPSAAPSEIEAAAALPFDEPAAEPAPMEEYFKPSAYSSAKPVPARPEPAPVELPKSELPKSELAQSELTRSDLTRSDLAQPDPAPAEPPKSLTPAPETLAPAQPLATESARAEPPTAPRPPVAEFAAKPTPPMPAAPLPPQGAAFSAEPKPGAKAPVPEAPMAMDVAPEAILPDEDDVPPAPAAEIVAAFASRRTAAIAAGGVAKPAASKIPAVGAAPNPRAAVPRPNLARPAAAPAQPAAAKPGASTIRPPIGKTAKVGAGATGASVTAPGILGAKRERPTVAATTAETPEIAARRAAAKPQTGLGSRPVATKGKPRYLGLILTGLLLLLLAAVAAWSSFFIGTNDATGALTPETSTSQTASVTAPPTETPAETTATPVPPETALPANGTTATDTTATAAAPQSAAVDPQPEATPGQPAASPSPEGDTAQAALPADAAARTATSAMEAAVPPPEGLASAAAAPGDGTSGSVANPAALADNAGKDGIVLAGVDAPPRIAGALPPPSLAAGADASPAAEPPPPPFGTVYKFDADGRIIPTPEGIMTPEGVLLVAGKPKQLPPDRPAALSVLTTPPTASDAAAAASAPAGAPATATPSANVATATAPANPADAATTASTPASTPAPGAIGSAAAVPAPSLPAPVSPALLAPAAAAPEPLAQDPTLAGKRPKARPAALSVPSDQQGALSQSTTDVPVADSRLAGFRPQARPAGLASAKTAVLAPDTGADATAASASLAANGATLLTSPKPQARPSGMDQAVVNDAVQAALNQAQPQATVKVQPAAKAQVAANTTAEPLDEPDLESPAPNLPTNASVAKQATVKRGLNTSQIALLAVFGTPSSRFAMVRQANGAVKRVKVGDNIDGGRVAAISDNSVQYQRGGRIVTLSLPSG